MPKVLLATRTVLKLQLKRSWDWGVFHGCSKASGWTVEMLRTSTIWDQQMCGCGWFAVQLHPTLNSEVAQTHFLPAENWGKAERVDGPVCVDSSDRNCIHLKGEFDRCLDPKERVQKLSSKRGMFDEHLFSMSTTRSTLHIENVELKRTQICTKLFKKYSHYKILTKLPSIAHSMSYSYALQSSPKHFETQSSVRNTCSNIYCKRVQPFWCQPSID